MRHQAKQFSRARRQYGQFALCPEVRQPVLETRPLHLKRKWNIIARALHQNVAEAPMVAYRIVLRADANITPPRCRTCTHSYRVAHAKHDVVNADFEFVSGDLSFDTGRTIAIRTMHNRRQRHQ